MKKLTILFGWALVLAVVFVANSDASAAKKTPPSVPRDAVATATCTNTNTITWTAPLSNGGSPITSYKIYRDRGTANGRDVATVSAATFSVIDSGGWAGDVHFYDVTAVNVIGDSPRATTAPVTTPYCYGYQYQYPAPYSYQYPTPYGYQYPTPYDYQTPYIYQYEYQYPYEYEYQDPYQDPYSYQYQYQYEYQDPYSYQYQYQDPYSYQYQYEYPTPYETPYI